MDSGLAALARPTSGGRPADRLREEPVTKRGDDDEPPFTVTVPVGPPVLTPGVAVALLRLLRLLAERPARDDQDGGRAA